MPLIKFPSYFLTALYTIVIDVHGTGLGGSPLEFFLNSHFRAKKASNIRAKPLDFQQVMEKILGQDKRLQPPPPPRTKLVLYTYDHFINCLYVHKTMQISLIHLELTTQCIFVLYCIVLYCIVLYCNVLYCIVLYCIILHPIPFYCRLIVLFYFSSEI